MLSIAPATAPGSWMLAEALLRCDSAREHVEGAIAALGALDADCVWRARAIDLLRARLVQRSDELAGLLPQLRSIENGLVGR